MVSLLDSKDVEVVSYRYSSWGKILEIVDTRDNQIAARNPFRYRGYILDEETGMYYLKSRYYDPEVGRWINPEPNTYKSLKDGDKGWQVADDNVKSIFNNLPKITVPSLTKALSIGGLYGVKKLTSWIKNEVKSFTPYAFGRGGGRVVIAGLFVMKSWLSTSIAFWVKNPEKRAKKRGYRLK